MTYIADAGMLVAVDKRDREVARLLRAVWESGAPVRTSAAVVAQVWRDGSRQANLSPALRGIETVDLDARSARAVGELLALAGTSDVVDAHLGLIVEEGDSVMTSDEPEIGFLLEVRGISARLLEV